MVTGHRHDQEPAEGKTAGGSTVCLAQWIHVLEKVGNQYTSVEKPSKWGSWDPLGRVVLVNSVSEHLTFGSNGFNRRPKGHSGCVFVGRSPDFETRTFQFEHRFLPFA